VFVGKRDLVGPAALLGFQHWGIKVGDYWYEIETKSKSFIKENHIRISERPELNFPIIHRIGTTHTNPDDMRRIMEDWLLRNRLYKITDQNCQYWVYETLRKLGFGELASAKFLPQLSILFSHNKI